MLEPTPPKSRALESVAEKPMSANWDCRLQSFIKDKSKLRTLHLKTISANAPDRKTWFKK